MPRSPTKWDLRFMALADHVATWSKDHSTQVGCVLVDDHRHVIATGYNGFPRGVDDCQERYEHRPTKYLLVQHAEANAVLQAVAPTRGSIAYVTHRPCASCTGILIQAGIARIYTREPAPAFAERFCDSFSASDAMLEDVGIPLVYLP